MAFLPEGNIFRRIRNYLIAPSATGPVVCPCIIDPFAASRASFISFDIAPTSPVNTLDDCAGRVWGLDTSAPWVAGGPSEIESPFADCPNSLVINEWTSRYESPTPINTFAGGLPWTISFFFQFRAVDVGRGTYNIRVLACYAPAFAAFLEANVSFNPGTNQWGVGGFVSGSPFLDSFSFLITDPSATLFDWHYFQLQSDGTNMSARWDGQPMLSAFTGTELQGGVGFGVIDDYTWFLGSRSAVAPPVPGQLEMSYRIRDFNAVQGLRNAMTGPTSVPAQTTCC